VPYNPLVETGDIFLFVELVIFFKHFGALLGTEVGKNN
jgi:hypothetical protein